MNCCQMKKPRGSRWGKIREPEVRVNFCPHRGSGSFSMMASSNGNIFGVTGPLCGESIGHRWIPRTNASDAELWCIFDLRLYEQAQ